VRIRRSLIFLTLAALPSAAQNITFNKDIAPIVFESCAPCHHPGESAPFALLNYQDVRRRASQIVTVTSLRYMPPWPPEAGYGEFSGDRRLSDAQLRLIADWVKQGAPEGAAADLPAVPRFSENWQMGPPHIIVQVPEPFHVPAGGGDVFRNMILPVHVDGVRYVRGLELRPGNKRVVHHANIWIDRRRTLRARDHEDGLPGFAGMEAPAEARSDYFDPDSHLLFWKPGTVLRPDPPELAWRLDPETDLIVNLHFQPTGKEELIQPSIGLYFSSEPPTMLPMLVQLEHDGAIDIPPGNPAFTVDDHLKLPVDADLLGIYPHAHYIGKRVEAWATLPDGTRRDLIRITDWDINWQGVYTYKRPVVLPKGSTVEMRITFDNSAANPRNPKPAPVRVRTGPRSEDEMGHVWLQLVPKNESEEDPRFPLQEAVMRRRLEKYPDDFAAHCNLGALLEMRAAHAEAIAHLQQAVRLRSTSATAHNSLGAAYLAAGRLDDAIRESREALQADPHHRNARWNLARALLNRRDFAGASRELETMIRVVPDDVAAHASLGDLLCMENEFEAALPHYREAVRLRPADFVLWTNLGGALAMTGDFSAAVDAFEHAVRINPADQSAQDYLRRAKAALAARPSLPR
jgi:Flp pilus assembly protein TadD